ncbi:hypothetical protein MYX82_01885 [Acidobacteria bacterium AH-259-D05]|nr:hypothetical protein [Acidobacteria bacterium AH-259-D05]
MVARIVGMPVLAKDYIMIYALVDPKTKEPVEVKDGATGESVFTAPKWEASPPLRCSLGDICLI